LFREMSDTEGHTVQGATHRRSPESQNLRDRKQDGGC
jgi:hypothetical protein